MIETRPFEHRATTRRLAVFDSETDPFAPGRKRLAMFTCGFLELDTGEYVDFWGDDCCAQFLAYLAEKTRAGERFLIYCHNFGGFDAHLGLLDHIDPGSNPSIIGGRLASCSIGGQEFRDSYRIFPEALAAFQKDKFDYGRMERNVREENKADILRYQRHDCEYLGELIREFFNLFGERVTIGNTAIDYLQQFHGFERMRPSQDKQCRPFFFGGRCQVFLGGVVSGRWKIYDVNNMYGDAMRNKQHPLTAEPVVASRLFPITAFIEWEGENAGLMATRISGGSFNGSLDFTRTSGRFLSTRHEFEAGEDTGSIKPHRIVRTFGFREWGTFAEFIDFCKGNRNEAQENGDKIRDLFWKRLSNSAYGKFAQDPSNYERYSFSSGPEGIPEFLASSETPHGFSPRFVAGERIVWGRPSPSRHSGFYNVAVGASITGAARAKLFRGILAAHRPAYCDTDSIVCEGFRDGRVDIDPQRLGAWKLEAEGDLWVCAGKKLYALLSSDRSQAIDNRGVARERVQFEGRDYWSVKSASKGCVLTATEILKVAQGGRVKYTSDRPNFKLDGTVEFIERWIERTD